MKHYAKRLLSWALAIALLAGVLPAAAFATQAIEISSLEEITDLNGSYLLTQDITVTKPFGGSTARFNGSFDGGGHKVTVNISAESDYAGIFAILAADANVRNFTVEDSTLTNTAQYTGLVAGQSYGAISDVVVKNSTVNGYKFLGGIAGTLESGATMTRCAFESGAVAKTKSDSGDNGIGGLVGENKGTVSLCSNSASLVNDMGGRNCGFIGGVVGKNTATVTDCYNTGEICGTQKAYYAAGVVGKNQGNVINCYNNGVLPIEASTRNAVADGSAANCYYLDTAFTDYTSNGAKKTAEEFKTLAASLGEEWIDGTNNCPVLTWQTWKYSSTAIFYSIAIYVETLDGADYELFDTLKERAEAGEAVSYTPAELSGFTFAPENTENLLSDNASEALILKAYYTRNSYPLAWEVGDGTIDPSQSYTNGMVKYGAPITAPTPSKTGHTLSWDKTITTMPAQDTTITALWTPALYKVTFNANGGACSEGSWSGTLGSRTDKVTYGRLYGEYKSSWGYSTRTLPIPTHESLAFDGWYTQAQGGSLVTKDTTVTATEDHTLFAQWVAGHTLTFNANGGYLSGTTQFTVKDAEAFNTYFTIGTPTKSGYRFDGWFDANDTAFNPAAPVTQGNTYLAKWTPYTYYVTFNANGGQGSMARQSFTVGTEQNLSKCTLTKPGSRFIGWGAWSSATSPSYLDEVPYSQLPSYDGYSYTLYALWEEVRHTLTFTVTPDDAKIVVKNGSGQVQTPNAGVYTLLEGDYSYSVTRYGYETIEAVLSLTEETALELTMTKLPSFTVSFDVTKPAETGEVKIVVKDADGNEMTAQDDGSYDLIAGQYSYVVSAAGCGKAKANFTITDAGAQFVIALTIRTAWDGETRTQPQQITAEEATGVYEGMVGWYRITNGDELAWLANLINTTNGGCNANAVLANDIDLGEEPWTPAGYNYSYNFTGIFDGNHHTVQGLSCNGADDRALFGYNKGTIRNLLVSGTVTASGSNAGGIVAYQNGGSISSCGSYVTVTNTNKSGRCGGIAAYAYNADITSCFNAGDLTGGTYLGGVVGYAGGTMEISDCYNIGTLTGSDAIVETAYVFGNAGGILGNVGSGTVTVSNCYNAGAFEGMDKYSRVGAIIGTRGSATLTNCFYLDTMSKAAGNGAGDGATQITAEVLADAEMIISLGAAYRQDIGCGGLYPILTWQSLKAHTEAADAEIAATCTESGKTAGSHCSVCGQILIAQEEIPQLGHTKVATAAKAATCTEAGNTAYWYCSVCEKYFSDEACTAEITLASTAIAAKGHTKIATAAKAATCTEAGNTAYWYCSVCEKYFSDEACTAEITLASTAIAAKGHTKVATAAKTATCTEAGNTAYWYCSVCEKYFSDEACTAEITLASTAIAAKGHTKVATAAKTATCTEAGNTAYWYCSACEKYFSDEACTVEITLASTAIAAKGHTKIATAAKAATCTEAGNTAYWYCSVCGKYFSDEACTAETTLEATVIAKLAHTPEVVPAVPANCTATGLTAGSRCAVCQTVITAQTETAALGHIWDAGKVTKEPTATETGIKTYTCTRCAETKTEEIPATGEVKLPFTDVPEGKWYTEAVKFAVANKLMNGMGNNLFMPEDALTRAQLVTILYRNAGTPSVKDEANPFKDVAPGKWYTDAIVWAAKNRIVNGVSATEFGPDSAITREQIATILFRYAKAENKQPDKLSGYSDARDVSNYALDAMNWAVTEGIINGAGNKLLPQENATRAQVAAILMRWMQKNKHTKRQDVQ